MHRVQSDVLGAPQNAHSTGGLGGARGRRSGSLDALSLQSLGTLLAQYEAIALKQRSDPSRRYRGPLRIEPIKRGKQLIVDDLCHVRRGIRGSGTYAWQESRMIRRSRAPRYRLDSA